MSAPHESSSIPAAKIIRQTIHDPYKPVQLTDTEPEPREEPSEEVRSDIPSSTIQPSGPPPFSSPPSPPQHHPVQEQFVMPACQPCEESGPQSFCEEYGPQSFCEEYGPQSFCEEYGPQSFCEEYGPQSFCDEYGPQSFRESGPQFYCDEHVPQFYRSCPFIPPVGHTPLDLSTIQPSGPVGHTPIAPRDGKSPFFFLVGNTRLDGKSYLNELLRDRTTTARHNGLTLTVDYVSDIRPPFQSTCWLYRWYVDPNGVRVPVSVNEYGFPSRLKYSTKKEAEKDAAGAAAEWLLRQ